VSYAAIVVTFVLAQNVVLSKLLGVCPLAAASRSRECTIAVGSGVLFVGSLSGLGTWAAYRLLLVPLGLAKLEIVVFVLAVALATRLMEVLVRGISPRLAVVLGPHVGHTMLNSAVLGMCLIAVRSGFGIMQSFVAALAGAGGFALASGIMASIGAKLELEWVPRPLKGVPIVLVSAGLLALAFMAFDGAVPAGLPK